MKNKCKDCLNRKHRGQVCEKVFTKKWLTSHIEREHEPNSNNKTIFDNVNNNNKINLSEKKKPWQQPQSFNFRKSSQCYHWPKQCVLIKPNTCSKYLKK